MKKLLSLALALGFVTIGSLNVMAGDTVCPPAPLPGDVVDDNLTVVDGSCTLVSVEIEGQIKVLDGGALNAGPFVSIEGNIDVKPGGALSIFSSTVEGNIQCKGAGGCGVILTTVEGNLESKEALIAVNFFRNTVDGNVKANDNDDGVFVTENIVLGNVEVNRNGNVFPFPPPFITNNDIGGNLECKDNAIDPSVFGSVSGNTVDGNDKCSPQ